MPTPTPILQLPTQTVWPGDGVTTLWNFSFSGGYIDRSHVKAQITTGGAIVGVPLTFVSNNTVSTPAIPNGSYLRIYRETPRNAPLVNFLDRTTLKEESMDLLAKQAIFVAAEAMDALGATLPNGTVSSASAVPITAITELSGQTNVQGALALLASMSETNSLLASRLADTLTLAYGDALIGVKLDGVGTVARTQHARNADYVSVADFGVLGNGTDETAKIQAALDYAVAKRCELYFPHSVPGYYFGITSSLYVRGAVTIRGASQHSVQIISTGVPAGQWMLNLDCALADSVQQVNIEKITFRSFVSSGQPNGIRIHNASYVDIKNVRFFNLFDGVITSGDVCYTHTYTNVTWYNTVNKSVQFTTGFIAGGQYIFHGCTFSGQLGIAVPSTAMLDNLSLSGCNFEQGVIGVYCNGTIMGFNMNGCRTEGNDGVDIVLRPLLSTEYIGGVSINGCVFSASDAGATARIALGGDAGIVRGFSITGNSVTHGTQAYQGDLVLLNGDGESGIISGNYLRGTTCRVINAPRAGVVVFGNENIAGKLPEYWGVNPISFGSPTEADTFTTASGATPTMVTNGMYVSNGSAVSMTNILMPSGVTKGRVKLLFANNNTTLVNGSGLTLKGGVNVSPVPTSAVMVFVKHPSHSSAWIEESRNF